ncbi:EamA family transporter [Nitrospira sp. Nam74]
MMMTAVVIAIMVVTDAATDLFLTKGMRQIGEVSLRDPAALVLFAGKALSNRHVLISIACAAIRFAGFLIVLSWADLSFVFPATGMVYVVGTLAAKFILGETISANRWAGIMLVCLGVGLVSIP